MVVKENLRQDKARYIKARQSLKRKQGPYMRNRHQPKKQSNQLEGMDTKQFQGSFY